MTYERILDEPVGKGNVVNYLVNMIRIVQGARTATIDEYVGIRYSIFSEAGTIGRSSNMFLEHSLQRDGRYWHHLVMGGERAIR